MATQVQFRRGTTADISTFIGADGEVVVDTTKKTCVVNDGFQIAGYPLLREDGSNSALNVGSLSSCSLKFVNDPNTGIISPGADQIALVTGGASRLSIDSSGSVTIPGNLLVAGAFTGNITLDNGSAVVPALRFTNDPDTGIYLAGTNELAISTGGTQRLTTTTTAVTSTLPVVHPLGAAATPSLTFTADTNTGIYSPGADQVAISTSGTGRLFVDSLGQVGIGTSNPSALFTVLKNTQGSVGAELLVANDFGTAGSEIAIVGRTNGTCRAGMHVVADDAGTGTGNGNYLYFTTTPGGSTTETPRMTIDRSGRLGLGTSSPAQLLETQDGNIQIRNSVTLAVGNLSPYGLTFRNANQLGQDRGTIATIKPYLGTAGDNDFGLQFQTQATTAGGVTTKMTLTPGGSLGVGTTSPTGTIGAGYNSLLTVNSNANTAIDIKDVNGNWFIGTTDGSLVAYSQTATAERARIDSSGRLLVGTSTSINNALQGGVQIVGTGADAYLTLTRFDTITSAPAGIILGRSKSGTKGTNTAVADGDFLGVLEFTGADGGSNYRSAAQIAAYVDGAVSGGGAADMPGRLVFSTTADGASFPTERMRIPNGGGLSIGTTVSPNAVDQKTAIRIGALNVSLTTITNLSTTWTDITAAAGANGLAFVDIYNTSAGTQGNFLVSWRGYPANATVISSNNGTGLTINFQVVSGKLQMQTTSGTVSGGAYVWAG